MKRLTCSMFLCWLLALPSTAAGATTPADPPLTVPKATLDASVHCGGPTLNSRAKTPIMVVAGTGSTGQEVYNITKAVWGPYGHPVCFVDFPDNTTGDIQLSAQYLVNGIRYEYARAGKKIAILGISQGGLLPRWALTWWPSLRAKVGDVLSAAGTQHGTTLLGSGGCAPYDGCPASFWQQATGSNLLKALNAYPDETPGSTAWTTVRSSTDEIVQPQTGSNPTSSLKGATNILIQDVCPGRTTTHVGVLLDSVTFAAFFDAVANPGAAKVSRLPKDICSKPFGPGIDPVFANIVIEIAKTRLGEMIPLVPRVAKEPPVAAYALR